MTTAFCQNVIGYYAFHGHNCFLCETASEYEYILQIQYRKMYQRPAAKTQSSNVQTINSIKQGKKLDFMVLNCNFDTILYDNS